LLELARMRALWLLALLLVVSGCGADELDEAGLEPPEMRGPLSKLLDGKFDAAGHPVGSRVFQAETSCNAETGRREAEGWGARIDRDDPGLLCQLATSLESGSFVINARLMSRRAPDPALGPDAEVARLAVIDVVDGTVLAEKPVRPIDFAAPKVYTNLGLEIQTSRSGDVRFELRWQNRIDLRLDYVEVFRPRQRALLSPASGKPKDGTVFVADVTNPPADPQFGLSCDGKDLTAELKSWLADGTATQQLATYWARLRVPLSAIKEVCDLPARLRAEVKSATGHGRTVSRVTYIEQPPACAFEPGKPRVLITGFEPFPADTSSQNASEQAVLALADSDVPNATVMRMILPVEWETAAARVTDVMKRCRPDVVISFGEGGGLDLERTGRNRRDAAMLAGGVEDNRGAVVETAPVEADGPETRSATLPWDAIAAGLDEAQISYRLSDDAGGYICNNVLYSELGAAAIFSGVRAGFIHLSSVYQASAEDKDRLRKIVSIAIQRSLPPQATAR
jgi:pyroglutamyl-peptidase